MPVLALLPGDAATTRPSGTPAIVFDRMGGASGGFSVNVTDGWEFSAEKPLTVTSLGVWDHKNDGLGTEIPVGLWDAKGNLLAQATIPAGKVADEVDSFRYVSIEPVSLSGGQNYVIGAAYRPESKEYVSGSTTSGTFFSDGAIRWVIRRRIIKQDGLAFPEAQSKPPLIAATPGGFGPNFMVAESTNPRIYYRTHKVDDERRYALVKLPENPNGSHSRDLVVFVSLFAKKNGQLTQILVNGEPLGVGADALKSVASTVRMLSDGMTKLAGVRPDIRVAAPSWIQYSDLTQVIDACDGRVNPNVRRTPTLRVELSTYRDTAIPLVNADVAGRFIVKGDCVEDTWTGLLWQRDGESSGKKNFQQAAEYAASLKLNGLGGWRVPTIEELASIFPADDAPFTGSAYTTEQCCAPPHEYNSYWTSELDDRKEDYAYVYHWYAKGGANNGYASKNFVRVRCVRDVESVTTDLDTQSRRQSVTDSAKIAIRSSVSIRDHKARQIVDFLRRNVMGKTITGRVVTGVDNDRMESVFERKTTFGRLLESETGFGFDEVIEIRETIRPRSRVGGKSTPARQDNRRVILRHQYSVRRSTGEVVGYAREVSHNEGQLSTAAVVKRAVAELSNGELTIRTTTVGYDDHVTVNGFGPGAAKEQSKYSINGGLLQRSQANEFFAVNTDTLARKPNRRETELIVESEVK